MRVKTVLLDLDGTIYRGSELIDGALEAIHCITVHGLRLFFFTNNSEKNREQIAEKLNSMGISCGPSQIVNSGFVATQLIRDRSYRNVYLCGSENLRKEFVSAGIDLVPENEADVLVIGMDSEYDFGKMKKALNAAIRSKTIIACNVEKRFPCGKGQYCPGNGALVASIEYASGKRVDEILGKPNSFMFNYVLEQTGNEPGEILVVGDTYESDIAMAERCGAQHILIGSNEKYEGNSIVSIKDLPNELSRLI